MDLLNSNLKIDDIILRTDFNVPILNNNIQSTKRIDSSLETINFILNQEPNKLIIISHLGRPTCNDKKLSLEPIRLYLSKCLNIKIELCKLEHIDTANSSIVLLENIRFYPEETINLTTTQLFRDKLSNLGNVYINDAFGCHR